MNRDAADQDGESIFNVISLLCPISYTLRAANGITDIYLRLAIISTISSCLIPFFLCLNLVWVMIQHFILNGFRTAPKFQCNAEFYAHDRKYRTSISSFHVASPNLDKSPTSATTLWTPQWPRDTRAIPIDTTIDLEKAMYEIQGTEDRTSVSRPWEDGYIVPVSLKSEKGTADSKG